MIQNRTISNHLQTGYDSENDMHAQEIDRLVYELRMPAEVVNRSYRELLGVLKDELPKPFLPMLIGLVSAGVKQRLLRYE